MLKILVLLPFSALARAIDIEENTIQFQVKRLDFKARLPITGSANAAGYDLHSIEDIIVPARGQALIGTVLAFGIPDGNYGIIARGSGLAVKHSIDVGAGVIDSDWRSKRITF